MTNPFTDLGKSLLLVGGFLVIVGALLLLSGRIPWLGRLPGDILIERKNFQLYFPLGTCLLLSLLLTLFFSLFGKR